MSFFQVDILTPSKVVAKGALAESIFLPSHRGQINLLPEHTHIITSLGVGEISLFGGASDSDLYFFVSRGVCKVLKNKVTILAHVSEKSQDLNKDRAILSLQNALEALEKEDLSQEERERLFSKAERARIRIQLAERFQS